MVFGIPAIVGWWMGAPVPQEVDFDAAGAASRPDSAWWSVCSSDCCRPSLQPPQPAAGAEGRCRPRRTQTIRAHRIAAMVQIGIAMPFLVISGVMIDRVRTADFGFPTDGLAAARMPAPSAQSARPACHPQGRDGLRQAGGVRSVAIADGMPIDFDYREFRVALSTGRRSPRRTSPTSASTSSRRSARRCCAAARSRPRTA